MEQQTLRQQLPIHAIETSKGMLFFSNSELGQAGLRNYYQQLTDNYFSVHGESLPVREYSINRISEAILPLIDRSYKMNPDTGIGEFTFDPASLGKQDFVREGWKFEFEASMKPHSGDFFLLREHAHSRMSKHNDNVSRLLYLKEHGYSRDIIQSPSFEYAHIFQDLGEQINASINSTGKANSSGEPSKNLFDLVEEVQQKTAGIIQNDYDIRGHRSFERTMKDLSYDPLVGDVRLSYPLRQAVWEGKCIYLPEISATNPGLHYICADKEHQKLRISATPFSRQIYREENGQIVPVQPKNKVSPKKEKASKEKKVTDPNYKIMKQSEQSYTAIETAYGFLFFTHTTEGQARMQKFLQQMADHYFDPHFNLGPVNVYRAEGILRQGPSVNPGENLFTEYPYLKMEKTPEMEPAYQNEMKPTPEDFGSFCHNAHCESSHRNCNIIDALDAIASKARTLSELSRQAGTPEIQKQIEANSRNMDELDKLLKRFYDVRGHRTVENILSDPMDSVMVDGVRLFTPHRQVLAAGHVLFLPGEAKENPSHSYAWVNGDFTRIEFAKEPPGNKQVFKIEKALNKKQDVKKKKNTHPKL